MATTIDLHGQTETLKPEAAKYSKAFKVAEECFTEAYQLFNDPEFETKTGWKLDTETDGATVYTKPCKSGLMFVLTATPPGDLDTVFRVTIQELEQAPTWNSNLVFAKVPVQLSENVDITHYANPDVMIVKSRDFVTVRAVKKEEKRIYIACRSVDLDDFKESKNHVRGKLNLGCARMTSEGGSTKVEYLLAIDFKGMIPKSVVNMALGKMIIKDFEETKKHLTSVTAQ